MIPTSQTYYTGYVICSAESHFPDQRDFNFLSHLVLVDNLAKFFQEAVGQAGSAQGRQEFPYGLLSSFSHAPTSGEQNSNSGLMEHPAEHHQRRRRRRRIRQWGWKPLGQSEDQQKNTKQAIFWTHLDLLLLSRWAWSRKSRSQSVSTVSRAKQEEAEDSSSLFIFLFSRTVLKH